VVIPMLILPP